MSREAESIYSRGGALAPTRQLAISRFVSRTYGWMFLGLMTTGLISYAMATSEPAMRMMMENRGLFYAVMIAEFAVVMGLTAAANKLSAAMATLGFLFYSALNGVTFSVIFLTYTMTSVAQVFMISAGMFGGLAVFGTVTRKDLTGVGTFVGMGLWGLILLGVANIFMQSDALSLGLSAVGVIVFSGLTAYEAQRIRMLANQYAGGAQGSEAEGKGAIFGALSLYLNFINLFLSMLRLFGSRRD
jgi:FtsH-binding integral membrane protein